MTVRILHQEFLIQCRNVYSDGEAAAITSIIFECVTGLFKSDIIVNPDRTLSEEENVRLQHCLNEVLKQKPVQYITNEAWFYQMKFHVCEDVLIPRPETEQLVEMAINFLNARQEQNVLDIGTGSGCIPVAVKWNLPSANVTAIDVSEAALRIAAKNATEHKVDIVFLQNDFLDLEEWKKLSVYDAIVSNPPYIPRNEMDLLDKNVQAYEPHLALFVDDESPLLFYEKIALFGKEHLVKSGEIFMEVHEQYATAVSDYFRNNGYETKIVKDLFGKFRIVTAIHCP